MMLYLIELRRARRDELAETSFIDNHDGKTVRIIGPGGEIDLPAVDTVRRYRTQLTSDKKENIRKVLGMDYEFRAGDGKSSKKLLDSTRILFGKTGKVIGLEYRGKKIYVTKDKGKTYSKTIDVKNQEELREFEKLKKKAIDEYNETEIKKEEERYKSNLKEVSEKEDVVEENLTPKAPGKEDVGESSFDPTEEKKEDAFETSLLEVREPYVNIRGLTETENRELRGVLYPSDSIDKTTRPLFLREQVKKFQRTIDETNKIIDSLDPSDIKTLDAIVRLNGLERAKDLTLQQLEKEEVRSQQEEDISRFQRFKEWAKENLLGLSALAVAIGGIITAVVVSARSVIYKGAAGVSKLSKAVYNFFSKLAKTLGPVIGPILSAVGSILAALLKFGAKGIEWLSKNLWALVVAITLIIYERAKAYQQSKKGR